MTDYPTLRQRHVAEATTCLAEHFQRLSWPASLLRAEREAGLRRLVRTAQEKSPWHARRLAGLDAETLTEADLGRIPPMTKDDLMRHWDEIVTDRRLSLDLAERHLEGLTTDAYLLDEFHVVASGGSSGQRGVFAWGWEAWMTLFALTMRWVLREVLSAGEPPVAAIVAAEKATHMTAANAQTFSNPQIPATRLPITLPLADIVEGLNRAQPTIVYAYSSALHALAHEAERGTLRIHPRWIVSSSEPLLSETRELVGQVWGVGVMNCYGTSEGGVVAQACSRSTGMHLNDDCVIVEPIDAAGRPVPAGVTSAKALLTNLYNPLLPLIRFEMTDEISLLDEPCPCGAAQRRISDIQGRVDDAFEYPGGTRVHPHVFRSVLGGDRHVIEYQVRQTPAGADILVRGSDVATEPLRARLAAALERAGLQRAEIALRVVPALPRQESGKMRRFTPLAVTAR